MGGYKDLLTYKQTKEIYDLTFIFCQRFLMGREYLRLREQMIQAARSGKQNIAEGYNFRSTKSYIKLLSVSRGSLEELLEDYLDFIRQRHLPLWVRGDRRIREMRQVSYNGKTFFPIDKSNPSNPSYALNYLVDLIKRTTYLLDRQIRALEDKFIKEGGYTENLFKRRLAYKLNDHHRTN